MWSARYEKVQNDVFRYRLCREDHPVSYRTATRLLRHDPSFREWFSGNLAAAPMRACFWEVRPVTAADDDAGYEYVLIDAPSLSGLRANPGAFGDVFDEAAAEDIAYFDNLGHDAVLVAPVPAGGGADCAHLLGFLRTADATRIDGLWQVMASRIESMLSDRPLWVSTSGLGVPWLHVRLDSVPKYYNFRPYRVAVTEQC